MESFLQILTSGLTLGAIYALSSIALSLMWGSLNMLNMAQGALLTVGGYASYAAVTKLGFPIYLGLPAAMLVGCLLGVCIYHGIVRFMLRNPNFETRIIIATIGLALILESIILKIFGAYPFAQPLTVPGGFEFGGIVIAYRNALIIIVATTAMLLMAWLINATTIGRAIRATALNRDAAQLMGVPVQRIFVQVLALSGLLAAVSGVMLSTVTTLSPNMGYDPMVKAFIICVVAGLGNVPGALYASFALGLFEASVQYFLGVRFGFASMLILVIIVLVWRPDGLFGRKQVTRL